MDRNKEGLFLLRVYHAARAVGKKKRLQSAAPRGIVSVQRHFAFLTGSSRCAGSDGKEARVACALVLRMENGCVLPKGREGHAAFFVPRTRGDGREGNMVRRVAVMGVIVEKEDSVERLNALLHDFREYIIGRMGIPYRARGINIISIFLDAPQDAISSLAGKIGNLDGISVKTVCSNVQYTD